MSIAEDYTASPRFEPMRIAGRKVEADGVVEVRYPYTNEVIGQVPAGDAPIMRARPSRSRRTTSRN